MSRARHPVALRLTLAASLALVVGEALAASGTFTFVTGEVSVVRANGQRVAATRGTEVDPGDSIVTGANGMAQLTMIDQARLSLRPGTQFQLEQYQRRADSDEGAVLSLLRGTLRTFTGLIASKNRDKFVMKTRVATVGIRGSGNILYACSQSDKNCDASVTGAASGTEGDITVNHTIEGSHAITNIVPGAPGVPAQQGGATTLITGPGQTVLVQGAQPPRYIPTPTFISDTATNPTNAAKTPTSTTTSSGDTRDFAPGEARQIAATTTASTTTGNLGPGFTTVDASNPVLTDNTGLQDVVIATNGAFLNQSNQLTFEGSSTELRGYTAYPGTLTGVQAAIVGGTLRESRNYLAPGTSIYLGRYENASLGFSGPGSATPMPGSIHWIYAPSGYPTYTSDVLTGVASYTLAAATLPTNQNNTAGTLASAVMNVNFTDRTLGLQMQLSIPAAGGNAGGSWQMTASNVPFATNAFFASTGGRLVILNNTGSNSNSTSQLSGSIEGSFVGTGLQAAMLGYGISDFTNASPANHNLVTGVAALAGAAQNAAAPYREGRVSDPQGYLSSSGSTRNFSTTNRPEEVTANATGAVSTFVAPHPTIGPRATYSLGTAQVVQSGIDAETGLVWGRWGNGVAQLTGNGQSASLNVSGSHLHYIFAGSQQGPPQLPLTGTGVYDVIGSTLPTNTTGQVGTFGSATLDVNFTNRMAASTVNVTINGQNWVGTASAMPIYRDQYFSAATPSTIPGAPNVSLLSIGCTPGCSSANTSGSFDGFFTGRSGQRAGMLYNMGGVQGAVAFGRRGG